MKFGFGQLGAFGIVGGLETLLAFVDERADGFFLFRRQAAELFEHGVEFAGFAEILGFDEFEGLLVGGVLDGGNAGGGNLFCVLHILL